MIEIDITKDMIEQCKAKAEDIGRLKNSITKGQGNLAGIVGEYVTHQHLKGSEWQNTYDYDLIENNKKIDVKTKRCSSKPRDNYDCSVAETSLHQGCDEYIFVRILNDLSKAWILGRMGRDAFFKKAKHMKKGQVDKSNNFKVHANCYNLHIKELDTL